MKEKSFNPEHSSTFTKALTKINVPEHYVSNPDQIDSMYRLQDSQAQGPSFVQNDSSRIQTMDLQIFSVWGKISSSNTTNELY